MDRCGDTPAAGHERSARESTVRPDSRIWQAFNSDSKFCKQRRR